MLSQNGGYLPGQEPAGLGEVALVEQLEANWQQERACAEQHELNGALAPEPWDNATNGQIKGDYRRTEQDVQQSRGQAEALAQRYGPGRHQTPWGQVDVSIDPCTGETFVGTRNSAGGSRMVEYGAAPDQTAVYHHLPDGRTSYETQNGTTFTRTRWGPDEAPQMQEYSLGPMGQPTETTYGPGLQWSQRMANPDGSSTTCGPYGEAWQPSLRPPLACIAAPRPNWGPFEYITEARP